MTETPFLVHAIPVFCSNCRTVRGHLYAPTSIRCSQCGTERKVNSQLLRVLLSLDVIGGDR